MQRNHQLTVLWDEIDNVISEDSRLEFPWEADFQGLVGTIADNHLFTMLCRTALSMGSSEEVARLVFLLLFSLY
jgi:hypothetical protein